MDRVIMTDGLADDLAEAEIPMHVVATWANGHVYAVRPEEVLQWVRFGEQRGALRERRRIFRRLEELRPVAERFDRLKKDALRFSNVLADAIWWFKGFVSAPGDNADYTPNVSTLTDLKIALDELADNKPAEPLPF